MTCPYRLWDYMAGRDMQDLLDKMAKCGCDGLDACGSVMRSRSKC